MPRRRHPDQRVKDLTDWIARLGAAGATIATFVALVLHSWLMAGIVSGTVLVGLVGVLVVLPRGRFGVVERRRLRRYHQAEVAELATWLPSDDFRRSTTHEQGVREVHGFVEPLFSAQEELRGEKLVVDLLSNALLAGKGVIVLGEPGSGKSLTAAIVFARLADRFAKDPRGTPCPIFINLNSLRTEPATDGRDPAGIGDPADWLREQVSARLTLPGTPRLSRLLAAGRVVLICDGLDEVPTMRSPQLLADVLPIESVRLLDLPPILLTCRTAFHSVYVDATKLTRRFAGSVELLPLRFEDQGVRFLRWYAAEMGKPALAPTLIKIIGENANLRETVARPLVLRMAAEVVADRVIADPVADHYLASGVGCETSEIYSRYVDNWLQREQDKQAADLSWWQKGELINSLAWEIFAKPLASDRGWGHFELKDLLIETYEVRDIVEKWVKTNAPTVNADHAYEEITNRSFLIISRDRRRYRFVHKSFFEFCVARHVMRCLDERRDARRRQLAGLFIRPLPDEIIDFVRELLAATKDNKEVRPAIEATFIAILVSLDVEDGPANLMAAQQAANLLPIVASDETMARLRSGDLRPEHPFLQRAIAVADALHCDRHDLLDDFVRRMEHSSEAESFHMGYNRIYYGDQAFGSGQWTDDGHPECGRFFRASVRHLKVSDYRHIRVMDLYTLRAMLRDPDRRRYLLNREGPALRDLAGLLDMSDPGLGHDYDRQRRLLLTLVNELLREHTT
jgi:NACHT domain